MNRHRLVLCLFLLAAAVSAQVVQPGSGSPKAGEWTANQAFEGCKKLFKALGISTEGIAQMKLSYRPMRRTPGEWHGRKEPEQYSVTMLASNGMVTEFGFGKRQMGYASGRSQSSKQFFKNEKQAKAHLLRLAKALGVSETAKLVNFDWTKTPDFSKGRIAASVSAQFADAAGKRFAQITCDAADGALVSFRRQPS